MANRAIATPIKGVVPHPGATLPYSEFNGFNKSPTAVRLGPDLELPSTVCVAINPIFYSLRSVDFVYHFTVNKGSYPIDPLWSWNYIIMETATLVAISISGLLVSFTGYALYTAFGQPSQQLRDPFEEHGD